MNTEQPTEPTPEPETPDSNVFHLGTNVVRLNAIRSYGHGLTTPRPLGAPWPRQVTWRDIPPSDQN